MLFLVNFRPSRNMSSSLPLNSSLKSSALSAENFSSFWTYESSNRFRFSCCSGSQREMIIFTIRTQDSRVGNIIRTLGLVKPWSRISRISLLLPSLARRALFLMTRSRVLRNVNTIQVLPARHLLKNVIDSMETCQSPQAFPNCWGPLTVENISIVENQRRNRPFQVIERRSLF